MNILFTVCGRANSKGVKNKNLKDFLGKPLVHYTLAAIELYKQNYIDKNDVKICLNTDSQALIDLVLAKNEEVFIVNRDESLAGDTVAKIAVIKDCLQKSENYFNKSFDVVVDLDITSPLRTAEDIRNAINKKLGQPGIDVVFSVTNSRRNPYFNMVKKNDDGTWSKVLESEFTTRQQTPEICDMNASIYAYNPQFLRTNTSNMLFDGRCDIIKMLDTAVIDIDSEEDFELMEVVARYLYKKNGYAQNLLLEV